MEVRFLLAGPDYGMSKMKHLVLISLFVPVLANACIGFVVGFRGINGAFDNAAFIDYAKRLNYCSKAYDWDEVAVARKMIKQLRVPYQLYGFSKGAASVAKVLRYKDTPKPEYVITMGAYRTTDVNFDRYGIRYDNYFDASGIGQKSPGTFLKSPHFLIQQEVNRIHLPM